MKKEEIINYITTWLKNYIQTNRLNGFVLGISGGIDSALVSTLCARTGQPTLCIEMPIHQADNQSNRAKRHIHWLKNSYANVDSVEVNLTDSFEALTKVFPKKEHPNRELALANTRARLRMTTLYYFAGLEGLVVTGTGNKIEDFGIGFYTKYGDGGVDVNPIADLTKSEVFKLSKFLKIDTSILQAKPTDGLFDDDRSDEDQIGATYPELEWAMQEDQKGKNPKDFTGRKAEVLKIYQQRHRANQHKWLPIPVCKIPESLKK